VALPRGGFVHEGPSSTAAFYLISAALPRSAPGRFGCQQYSLWLGLRAQFVHGK